MCSELIVLMIKDSPKLLVVTGAGLASSLTDYALKVAIRLDLDIFFLFVAKGSASASVKHRRKLVKELSQRIEEEVAAFTSLARKSGIQVTVVVDVGERKEVINRLRSQDSAIRFILINDCQSENNNKKASTLPRLTVVE